MNDYTTQNYGLLNNNIKCLRKGNDSLRDEIQKTSNLWLDLGYSEDEIIHKINHSMHGVGYEPTHTRHFRNDLSILNGAGGADLIDENGDEHELKVCTYTENRKYGIDGTVLVELFNNNKIINRYNEGKSVIIILRSAVNNYTFAEFEVDSKFFISLFSKNTKSRNYKFWCIPEYSRLTMFDLEYITNNTHEISKNFLRVIVGDAYYDLTFNIDNILKKKQNEINKDKEIKRKNVSNNKEIEYITNTIKNKFPFDKCYINNDNDRLCKLKFGVYNIEIKCYKKTISQNSFLATIKTKLTNEVIKSELNINNIINKLNNYNIEYTSQQIKQLTTYKKLIK